MLDSITITTPGKINLALAVGANNYEIGNARHPICSWLVSIDLYDELTLTRLPADRFSRYAILWHPQALRKSEIDWPIKTDLAVQAHLLLETETNTRMPVQLKIEKRIPVGSGLGGGSSDAAAMLCGCNEMFALGLSLEQLKTLGERLGSDVPFFLEGKPCLATGFGEKPQVVNRSLTGALVLIFPEFGCATAAVYRAFDELATEAQLTAEALDERFAAAAARLTEAIEAENTGEFEPFNDLLWAAFRLEPRLRTLRNEICELIELPVHLTGSGSTLFVICGSRVEADLMAQAISERIEGVVALAVGIHQPVKI